MVLWTCSDGPVCATKTGNSFEHHNDRRLAEPSYQATIFPKQSASLDQSTTGNVYRASLISCEKLYLKLRGETSLHQNTGTEKRKIGGAKTQLIIKFEFVGEVSFPPSPHSIIPLVRFSSEEVKILQ